MSRTAPVFAATVGEQSELRVATGSHVDPISLRSGGGQLRFTFAELGSVVRLDDGRHAVETRKYSYVVLGSADPATELFAWHWHPDTYPAPHLHVPITEPTGRGSRLHVPTGAVTLAQVVRFMIDEMSVSPARSDWQRVLQA